MRAFIVSLVFIIFSNSLEANFFSDLFEAIGNKNRQSEDVRVQVEPKDRMDDAIFEEKSIFPSNDDEPYDDSEDRGSYSHEKVIYLSYLQYPKRVYLKQHFVISLKSIIIDDKIDKIKTKFIGGHNYKIINPNPSWKRVDKKSYQCDLYFKLLSLDAKLPKIQIVAINHKKRYKESINPKDFKLIELKQNDLFSQVIAKDLKVISHKEKRYDDKSILVLMELNGTLSNLEDFHLPFVKKEALDSFEEHLINQSVYYVCIVPNYQKEFKFKYFDLDSNRFTKISFPIIMTDLTLSTQLGLNPKKSKLYIYELIALFGLSLILFLIFLKNRSKLALFFSLAIALFTLFTKVFTPTLTLPKGIKIRILPTHNSTVFFKTPSNIEVKVLLKKEGYSKILLPGGKIGWIADDDLQKN